MFSQPQHMGVGQFAAFPLPGKEYVHDTSYHIRQGPCKATRSIVDNGEIQPISHFC